MKETKHVIEIEVRVCGSTLYVLTRDLKAHRLSKDGLYLLPVPSAIFDINGCHGLSPLQRMPFLAKEIGQIKRKSFFLKVNVTWTWKCLVFKENLEEMKLRILEEAEILLEGKLWEIKHVLQQIDEKLCKKE